MVEIIDDVAAFERLRPEWTRLLRASSADSLFLTWEWLYTWWQHLAGNRRLFILTVRSDNELIAIAPLSRSAPRVASILPLPSVEFLGTGTVGSDYLDIIVRRGSEQEALDLLETFLVGEGIVLEFAQLNAQRSAAATLADRLKGKGWSRVRRPAGVCPFINLTGHTWESYAATLGSEHRYNFNRRLKQATKNFQLRFDQARSPDECHDALDRLIDLHNIRWRAAGGSEAFESPDLLRFHHAISQLALDRQWLRLFVLHLDEVPVAALYGFFYQRVFYFYQSGYDLSYSKSSVGMLTMGLAIKTAIEDGAEEYDMLHGDESYKFQWAKHLRELEHLEVYAPDARATMARRVRGASRAFRRTARQMLPRTIGDRIAAVRRRGVLQGLYGAWQS
jgi:CelD/BcsL family acetyltransferase involved in cellulose biosynthesis